MGKAHDGAKTQNTCVMRGLPSETHQWQATRSETFTEVGWRAVCGESRKHGSEGGQRFLRVRVAYPTARAALRRPSLGMDDRAICVYNPGRQPCADQVEQGPVVDTQAPQVQEPRLVHVVKAALDISLSQGAIPSVLACKG